MRLLFDQATSPVLAATLDGFLRHRGHAAAHARDGSGDACDASVIAALGDGLLVSGDVRYARNRARRLACREAGLRVLLLAPAFLRLPMHEQAAALVGRWPEIEALQGVAGPFLQEVPAGMGDRLRVLSP